MLDIYQEINKIVAAGEEAALVTVISASRSTPRRVGAKMLVRPDGSIVGTIGGGAVEATSIRMAMEAIKLRKTERRIFNLVPDQEPGMVCGGEMEVLIEPILQTPTIYIFGGGHIGLVLAKISKLLDFNVVVIDDRAEFATQERFPDANLIVCEDFVKAFSRLKIDSQSYLVIVTHGHKKDEQVLEQALRTSARYIGMIGSKSKIKTVFNNLLAKGVDNRSLEAVHTPIGLEIYAETPEEIAISILAEIIKVRRTPVV